MRARHILPLLLLSFVAFTPEAQACGPDSPCVVESGRYRIRLPEGASANKPVGAIMHFHGYRGFAAGVMGNKGLAREMDKLGLALIAPNGANRTWSFEGSPSHNRDEMAFVSQILDDVLERFPIDPKRMMASGFSLGGSMVWNIACRLPGRFAGYAPIAGAFWRPLPADCLGANGGAYALPDMFHVHGTADTVVPMAGRAIRDIFHQGNVRKGIAVWLKPLAKAPAPTSFQDPPFNCRRWGDGPMGGIELCLHDGGHNFRAEWVSRAWRRLAQVKHWTG